ncbi:MAG: VOC family protein [Saprospiraceae bacterium]
MKRITTKMYWVIIILMIESPLLAQAYKISAVSITVQDMEKEIVFFKTNLDFTLTGDTIYKDDHTKQIYQWNGTEGIRIATLKLGNESIRLIQFIHAPGRPNPPDAKSNDLWFQHIAIVVGDMDKAYQKLRNQEITYISTSPQTLPEYLTAAAGIKAFYFSDPEGHPIELIYFPKDKGNPKWHEPTNALFLGIDHTAIVISNTKNSFAFYEKLGFKFSGHSENYGTEQEHLNQVFGARLDINGLHVEQGFGLEFLKYIAPRGGRLYPPDSKPWDLWHYQTEIEVKNIQQIVTWLDQAHLIKISDRLIESEHAYSVLFRDIDGHPFLLTQSKSIE